MEIQPKKIFIYTREDGTQPFMDWLAAIQDPRKRDIVESRINRVRLGNYGDHKRLKDGIIELRFIRLGWRIYFAEVGRVIVLILCAGEKNTKGEQSKDIARATEYWEDFKKESPDVESE